MYMCGMIVNFISIYDFYILFWIGSDSVVFFVLYFIPNFISV
jgi:hypothetical protein